MDLYVAFGAKAIVRPQGRFRRLGVEVAPVASTRSADRCVRETRRKRRAATAPACAQARAAGTLPFGPRRRVLAAERTRRASARSISAGATSSASRCWRSACSWASCCTAAGMAEAPGSALQGATGWLLGGARVLAPHRAGGGRRGTALERGAGGRRAQAGRLASIGRAVPFRGRDARAVGGDVRRGLADRAQAGPVERRPRCRLTEASSARRSIRRRAGWSVSSAWTSSSCSSRSRERSCSPGSRRSAR